SLNLAFELPAENTLRFALARQVARPRVHEMRASMDFGVDTSTGQPGAGGGTPELDPWTANAIDLSWEQYFGNKTYIAASVFYKDARTHPYSRLRCDHAFTPQVPSWLASTA